MAALSDPRPFLNFMVTGVDVPAEQMDEWSKRLEFTSLLAGNDNVDDDDDDDDIHLGGEDNDDIVCVCHINVPALLFLRIVMFQLCSGSVQICWASFHAHFHDNNVVHSGTSLTSLGAAVQPSRPR